MWVDNATNSSCSPGRVQCKSRLKLPMRSNFTLFSTVLRYTMPTWSCFASGPIWPINCWVHVIQADAYICRFQDLAYVIRLNGHQLNYSTVTRGHFYRFALDWHVAPCRTCEGPDQINDRWLLRASTSDLDSSYSWVSHQMIEFVFFQIILIMNVLSSYL